jgi:hypothetical protein
MVQVLADATSVFTISLLDRPAGNEVGRIDVHSLDLLPLMAETWRDGFLRKGRTSVGLGDLEFAIRSATSRKPCTEVLVDARLRETSGAWYSKMFSKAVFAPLVIDVCAQRIKTASLAEGAGVLFDLLGLDSSPIELHHGSAVSGVVDQPITFHAYPLEHLLVTGNHAQTSSPDFPVVFTKHAFVRAEKYARAGAMGVPPTETGCMLLGHLCVSTGPAPEAYVVVTEALRISAAESTTFSLTFSAESWTRVERYLAARAGEGIRATGCSHGHPFDCSSDGMSCGICPKCPSCAMDSAFLSTDDRLFMKALFPYHRHPFQLAQVFGMGAGGQPRDELFTMRDGRLLSRPYSIIEKLPADFLKCVPPAGGDNEEERE